ncbi:MAG: hypothetical protein RL095_2336 [Verrucomicrobiota bacterium]|jgi:hypothetical protein
MKKKFGTDFVEIHVNRDLMFTIGQEMDSKRYYLSIPEDGSNNDEIYFEIPERLICESNKSELITKYEEFKNNQNNDSLLFNKSIKCAAFNLDLINKILISNKNIIVQERAIEDNFESHNYCIAHKCISYIFQEKIVKRLSPESLDALLTFISWDTGCDILTHSYLVPGSDLSYDGYLSHDDFRYILKSCINRRNEKCDEYLIEMFYKFYFIKNEDLDIIINIFKNKNIYTKITIIHLLIKFEISIVADLIDEIWQEYKDRESMIIILYAINELHMKNNKNIDKYICEFRDLHGDPPENIQQLNYTDKT